MGSSIVFHGLPSLDPNILQIRSAKLVPILVNFSLFPTGWLRELRREGEKLTYKAHFALQEARPLTHVKLITEHFYAVVFKKLSEDNEGVIIMFPFNSKIYFYS